MTYRFEYRIRNIGTKWYAERRRIGGWLWKKCYETGYFSREGAERACRSHASFCRRCRNEKNGFKSIYLGSL